MTERGDRLLLLLALANAGGMIAYVPLLTLLLPAKIAVLAGDARIEWLGAATLVGAVAASVGNLGFGWASDVTGSRRAWASAGLALTIASYAAVHAATTLAGVVLAIAGYQLALNMLLAPIAAWAADVVPDHRKGLLGGLLGAAPPLAALAGVVATLPALGEPGARMAATCAMASVMILPLLLLRAPSYSDAPSAGAAAARRPAARRDFALLWSARLMVQIAGSVLFGFLYFYFRSLSSPPSQAGIARLSALALILAFPVALILGRLSDRVGQRKPFLAAAAVVGAAGLTLMALRSEFTSIAAGYALFGCASAVFLSLHSTYAMQLLPSPTRRGRDLGVINLSNTLPSVLAPLLAVWLVPNRGFTPLLIALAALMLLAAIAILFVRHERQQG